MRLGVCDDNRQYVGIGGRVREGAYCLNQDLQDFGMFRMTVMHPANPSILRTLIQTFQLTAIRPSDTLAAIGGQQMDNTVRILAAIDGLGRLYAVSHGSLKCGPGTATGAAPTGRWCRLV